MSLIDNNTLFSVNLCAVYDLLVVMAIPDASNLILLIALTSLHIYSETDL